MGRAQTIQENAITGERLRRHKVVYSPKPVAITPRNNQIHTRLGLILLKPI